MRNPGAQESFSRGGSDQVLREAVLEVLGVAPAVRAIAGSEPAPAPAPTPAFESAPAPEPSVQRQQVAAGAEQARANIRATQVGPVEEEAEVQESPDDIDLDDDGIGADELLAKHLGAELIGEEEPAP